MDKKNFFKNLLFFILGMMAGVIFFISFIFFIVISFSGNSTIVYNNSWLVLDFAGEIVERPIAKGLNIFNSQPAKIQLIDYLKSIERAGYDKRIDGIIINGDLTSYSKAYIEEISKELEKFKESGKEIIAWFSDGNNKSYELCLSADKIYMPDADSANLTLKGYYQSIPYLKKVLDNIGLDFNVVHIGSFKGTGENFIQEKISDQLKNSYLNLLIDIYNKTLNNISKKRNINLNRLKALYTSGKTIFLSPKEALEYKFIDGLKYYDEIFDEIEKYKNINRISLYDYISSFKNQKIAKEKIAIIYAEGTINNYYTSDDYFGEVIIGAKTMIRDIRKIKNDKSVKAVILRVNSPGGSALASELILQELIKLKKEKPLYVSFGPTAASGGYYISCAGEKIFTTSSTITGSIGVVSIFLNHKNLSDKLGINFETIKINKFDDFLSISREPTIEEIEILRKSMIKIYNEFTDHVMIERKIDKLIIPKISEGRVWTGNQSVENKLSDEIGGLRDVIEYAVETNKITNFSIDSYPKAPSLFEKLAQIEQTKSNFNIIKLNLNKQILKLFNYYSQNGSKPVYLLPYCEQL
ncbi:MAG: signal peptide peptidase SppA [Spirochaetes bacterium]|nr:signal peptide peptidase SppA [Spirochaetota bacterium]